MFNKELIENLHQREKAQMVRTLIENLYEIDSNMLREDTYIQVVAALNKSATEIDVSYQILNIDGNYHDHISLPTRGKLVSWFKQHPDMFQLGSDYFNGAYALIRLMDEIDRPDICIKFHFDMIDVAWLHDEKTDEYKEGNTYWGTWYDIGVPTDAFVVFEKAARQTYQSQLTEWNLLRNLHNSQIVE